MRLDNTKIAIFILSLQKGGSEKQALLLSNYLSRLYNTHLIVFSKTKILHPVFLHLQIKPFFLEGNFFKKIFTLFRHLKQQDITHLFNYLPSNNVIGSIIGKLAGVPFIFGGIRGTKTKSFIKSILMYFVFNNICTKVISNSNAAKKVYVNKGVKEEKIIVIPNGIEIPEKKMFLDNDKYEINILSVGRFIEEKDFTTAIESISLLNKDLISSNYKFIYNIVGYGPLQNILEEKIRSLNLSSIVTIHRETESVYTFYQESDIYLSTSTHEGMSNTIMEALSYSLPVVCTDVGDSDSLVIDGYNGFLCKPKDVSHIAESLLKLVSDKELRLRMAENAYEHISSNFSVEKSFSKYDLLINEYAVKK